MQVSIHAHRRPPSTEKGPLGGQTESLNERKSTVIQFYLFCLFSLDSNLINSIRHIRAHPTQVPLMSVQAGASSIRHRDALH